MVQQARATATRQKIIDVAVDLFADLGYADTGLNDIIGQSGISAGAFYYHFDSKEALTTAIVSDGCAKASEVFSACIGTPRPGLENVITMTFSLSDLMKRDKTVRIAQHLGGGLGQLGVQGRLDFGRRASAFVGGIARSLGDGDVLDGVDVDSVGAMVWTILHGCAALSDAMDDSVIARLTQSWRLVLPSIVRPAALSYFDEFLWRTATQYGLRGADRLARETA